MINFNLQKDNSIVTRDKAGTDIFWNYFSRFSEARLFNKTYQNCTYIFEISHLGYNGEDVVLNTVPVRFICTILLSIIGRGLIGWLRKQRTFYAF